MSNPDAARQHMKRIFTESFSVSHIAEPLASFDGTTPAGEVLDEMMKRAYKVVGVRLSGAMAGYVDIQTLGRGDCGDFLRSFDDAQVIADSANLAAAVLLLSEAERLFVTAFGQVAGIVTRTDLQKPPVRMWLFGMVTIIEMSFVRLMEARFADDGWRQYLSQARQEKAETLFSERKRRGQEISLIDCLQFADKGQVVVRDEVLRAKVGFPSRRQGEDTVKRLEALRNNLAHSQDIVSGDFEIIVRLVESLDRIVAL